MIKPIKNGQSPEQTLPKEDIQVADKYVQRCSVSCVIREIQMKRRCHHVLSRTGTLQNVDDTKCWRRCGAQDTHARLVGMQVVQPLGRQLSRFS
jgi:hypothetical protein